MIDLSRYAALVCDLDGVVYRGPLAIAHAVESINACRKRIIYATNNASRTPDVVADHLRSLGLSVSTEDVVTSSQATAWILEDDIPPPAPVLAIGGDGVAAALTERGYAVMRSVGPGESCQAVVQGYGPDVTAADLAEAAYAVEQGALWLATNIDATLPTNRGIAPGNGSLVTAVATAVGHRPTRVAGKPEAPCYLLAAERLGLMPEQILAIGDRIDTDIAGAHAAGMDSLLVLTGVSSRADAEALPEAQRPTHVAPDLRVLTP